MFGITFYHVLGFLIALPNGILLGYALYKAGSAIYNFVRR